MLRVSMEEREGMGEGEEGREQEGGEKGEWRGRGSNGKRERRERKSGGEKGGRGGRERDEGKERALTNFFFRTKPGTRSLGLLLFLNCTRELIKARKQNFEISEKFLIFLMDSYYGDRFATFIFSSEEARVNFLETQKPGTSFPSFWSHVRENPEEYANPDYTDPGKEAGGGGD
jgi:hypothetical protein